MKKLRTIRITHDITNRIEFLFFAEFFRMCGVYVGEYIYDKTHQNKEINIEDSVGEEDFDVDLYVGSERAGNMPKGILPEMVIYYQDIQTIIPNNIFLQTEQQQMSTLTNVINSIGILADEAPIFNKLGSIYVSNNLMLHLANQQYYRMNVNIHDEAIEAFSKAYDSINNINNMDYNTRYHYAKIYCANKANLACSHRHYSMKYRIEDLVLQCQEILKQESEFFNVWTLIGLVYEQASECGRQAINAFLHALKEEDSHSYVSHIYYFMGKRYEPYAANREDMIKCFNDAYRNKPRYRNLYKLAIIDYQDKKYEEALQRFEEIKGFLSEKRKRNLLDPLEVEYFYKICSMACFICYRCLEQYEAAIKWGEEACKIYAELQANLYFKKFYKTQCNQYIYISEQRMNLEKVYFYLAVSYRETGNSQEADNYWEKINIKNDME